MKQKLVIIGAGGLGREIAAMVDNYFKEEYDLLGFVDDGKTQHDTINGIYLLGNLNWLKKQSNLCLAIGIANPQVKAEIVNKLKEKAFAWPNLIHPSVQIHHSAFVKMGKGNIITAGNILTVNINIGSFNLINLSCTIGHDAVLGSFCSIMPGVNISGGAQLKDKVYVGTGAKLIKATTLHHNCKVGAGAVVNTDVPSGETWVGIPAKKIST